MPPDDVSAREAADFLKRRKEQLDGVAKPAGVAGFTLEEIETALRGSQALMQQLGVQRDHYLEESQRLARIVAWFIDEREGGILTVHSDELDPQRRGGKMIDVTVDTEGWCTIELVDPPPASPEGENG